MRNTIPVASNGMPDFETVRQLRAEGHSTSAIAEAAGVNSRKLHGWYASQFSMQAGGKNRQFQMPLEPKVAAPIAPVVVEPPTPEFVIAAKKIKAKNSVVSPEKREALRTCFEAGMRPGRAAKKVGVPANNAWGHYMVWHPEMRARMPEPPPIVWNGQTTSAAAKPLPAPPVEARPLVAPAVAVQPLDAVLPMVRCAWNGYLMEKGYIHLGKHLTDDDVRAMLTLFQ